MNIQINIVPNNWVEKQENVRYVDGEMEVFFSGTGKNGWRERRSEGDSV
jgi:hypothetical protein